LYLHTFQLNWYLMIVRIQHFDAIIVFPFARGNAVCDIHFEKHSFIIQQ